MNKMKKNENRIYDSFILKIERNSYKKHPADSQNHTSRETVELCDSVERDKEEGISKRNFLPCFPASYPARKESHAFWSILLL